ncbi:MAG: metallophosphoesterase [Frankiales bacterium]|nr:metallophosphoesterase [Frankiales bacterium]
MSSTEVLSSQAPHGGSTSPNGPGDDNSVTGGDSGHGGSGKRRGGPVHPRSPRDWLSRFCLIFILVLTPLAAGLVAFEFAPPARVHDVGVDGLSATVGVHIGQNATDVNFSLIGLRRESPTVLGRHVGVEIRPDATDLSIFTSQGILDQEKITVAAHFFADRDAILDKVFAHVVRYYLFVFCLAAYLTASAEILGYAYVKHRRNVRASFSRRQRVLDLGAHRLERHILGTAALIGVLGLLVPSIYILTPLSDRSRDIQPQAELRDTFLDGWQITGPLKLPIMTVISSIDALSKQEKDFYDQVATNLSDQYGAFYNSTLANGATGPGIPATTPAAPDGSGSLSGGAGADGADGSNLLAKNNQELRYVILDDLQGTSGMARIVGEAANLYHANAIINLGDLTATGTKEESYASYLKSYTVDVLARYAGKVPVYSSLGRHDTPTVATLAKKAKITVADGTLQKLDTVPYIGVNSAYIVNFGDAARLINPEITDDTVSAATTTSACSQSPAMVFGHDKELLGDVTQSGCVPIVIGGHSFTDQPSQNVVADSGEITREITLGSTGGHGSGDGIGGLSTPRNNATFKLLRIDKKTGAVTVDTTTVSPSGSVTVASNALASLTPEQLARFK